MQATDSDSGKSNPDREKIKKWGQYFQLCFEVRGLVYKVEIEWN